MSEKEIVIDEDKLTDLATKVCNLGESLDITPQDFAIMLSVVAKYLCEIQEIEFLYINVRRTHDMENILD